MYYRNSTLIKSFGFFCVTLCLAPCCVSGQEADSTKGQSKSEIESKAASTNKDQEAVIDSQIRRISRLTKNATTATEFSNIIDQCDKVLNRGVSDNRRHQLESVQSWALNRRGEHRLDLAENLKQVNNIKQSSIVSDQAFGDFSTAIEKDAKRWRAYLNRGVLLAQQKIHDAALSDFETVCQLQPEQSNGWFNYAELMYDRQEYDAAIKSYSKVLEINSGDIQSLTGRGHGHFRLGNYESSLADYNIVLKLKPGDSIALVNRGDVYFANGNWRGAYDDYLAAAKTKKCGEAYQRAAWLFATCPDEEYFRPQTAIELADNAIESQGKNSTTLGTLAAAQAANGDFQSAIKSQTEAIELSGTEDSQLAERLAMFKESKPIEAVIQESSK